MARFLRLPFTLVALWDIHVTMTPPNATPPDDERKTFKALDIERAAVPFALLSKVGHLSSTVYTCLHFDFFLPSSRQFSTLLSSERPYPLSVHRLLLAYTSP